MAAERHHFKTIACGFIPCSQPSSTCYTAFNQSLDVDCLLPAHWSRSIPPITSRAISTYLLGVYHSVFETWAFFSGWRPPLRIKPKYTAQFLRFASQLKKPIRGANRL